MNTTDLIKTGLTSFDNCIGGLAPGQVITVAGRPAMGKTALATTLMVNIGVDQQIPVAFLSIEMSNSQVIKRLIKNMEFDETVLEYITGTDKPLNYPKELMKFINAPVYIDDTPTMSIDKIADLASSTTVKILIIDYLQLIEDFMVNPDEIMKRLKDIAVKNRICIMGLSQVYDKDINPLVLDEISDTLFRDGTTAIMNNSDVILFLYRLEGYVFRPFDLAEMIIFNGKYAQQDIIQLNFSHDFAKFTNLPPVNSTQ